MGQDCPCGSGGVSRQQILKVSSRSWRSFGIAKNFGIAMNIDGWLRQPVAILCARGDPASLRVPSIRAANRAPLHTTVDDGTARGRKVRGGLAEENLPVNFKDDSALPRAPSRPIRGPMPPFRGTR